MEKNLSTTKKFSNRTIIVAGVMGVLFGALGVHDFMLRRYVRGIIHLALVSLGLFIIFVQPTWNTLLAWCLIIFSFAFGVIESNSIFGSLSAVKADTEEKRQARARKITLLYFGASILFWLLAGFFVIMIATPATFGIQHNISMDNGMFIVGMFMFYVLPTMAIFLALWFIAVLKSFKYDKTWLRWVVNLTGTALVGIFFFAAWLIVWRDTIL